MPLSDKGRQLTTWMLEEGPVADLDLARVTAPYLVLDAVRANAIIDEVAAVLDGWQQMARPLRMSASDLAAYATAIRDSA